MSERVRLSIAVGSVLLVAGCTTGDRATPADTATSQSTSIVPANSSAPVLSAPVDTTVPVAAVVKPKSSAPAKATGTKSTTEPPMYDSAFKPRATVDEKGNIQPIKRDSLR